MTEDRKPTTPGMAEVSAKFVHKAEAAASGPLLEIIRKYHEADAASDRSYEALDEAEGAARRGGIKLPRWGLVEFKMERTQWTLGRGEIKRAATSAGHHGLHLTTEQRDAYLAQLDDLRREGLERYKELGLDTLYLENERCNEAYRESLKRVCETPATSVDGFAAKVLVFCDHSNEDNVPPVALSRSVKADAERFARKGQRKEAALEGHDDLYRLLTESAEKGNKKAQSMLDEDFDWRNMSFVRCQGTKTTIQWPPVELTGEDGSLVREAACVIGNHCALDLLGHIKSHSKNYGGDRLLNIAQEIVTRGEWGGLEIGFFSALGDFIARGRITTSADFDAVLTTAAAASSASDPVAQIGRDLAAVWRKVEWNDENRPPADAPAERRNRFEHLDSYLGDRWSALEAMAVEIQAGSLEGAMVQIMLAHAEADMMAATTEESNEAQMRTISKLLYSALAAIEQAAGVPREEMSGGHYMCRELDPHVLVAEAMKKNAA